MRHVVYVSANTTGEDEVRDEDTGPVAPVTTLTTHPSFRVGPVDERIFGGFLEHLGRAVYGGVYDPTSPLADEHGCRTDVLAALRDLGLTVVRYPGGNFVSGYHWLDGVGPVEDRPTVRELAWKSVETNRFGTDEFLGLAARMGWTPMLAVNLGTGTPEEAADWIEYTNSAAGSRYAELRRANGRDEPWGVPLWCLGNEMDGPWQLGHAPVEQYASRAQQAAVQMKLVDPTIETVACGSSMPDLPTFGHWDRQVLERVGTDADYLSLHFYAGDHTGDVQDYLGVGAAVDRQLDAADAVCRHVAAAARRPRRPYLCFDEWNVWYRTFGEMDGQWRVAPPLIEETYDLADALVVGQFLMSFLRRADVVKIANLAQIVNVIAPLLTRGDELLVQSTFHAFRMFSQRRTGVSLQVATDGPRVQTSHGRVPLVDSAAVADGATLHVFAVNRSVTQRAPVRLDHPAGPLSLAGPAELLTASAPDRANSFDQPDAVRPVAFDAVRTDAAGASFELPPHSLVALTFTRPEVDRAPSPEDVP